MTCEEELARLREENAILQQGMVAAKRNVERVERRCAEEIAKASKLHARLQKMHEAILKRFDDDFDFDDYRE